MPQFSPGEQKTAIAPVTVQPSGLSSEIELYLGPDEHTVISTSGRVGFISTGAKQNISLPVTMPQESGSYRVYIDVYAGGTLVGVYKTIEDVVIGTSFVGFSLRLAGTWGPLWFARIFNWNLNEHSLWVTGPAPGWSSIKVWCFDNDFSSPSDPEGVGKEFTCNLEDGHNYILDVSQGNIGDSIAVELQEDPNPPDFPVEPVDVPMILSYKLPVGPVHDTIHAEVSAYLPQEYLGYPTRYYLHLLLHDSVFAYDNVGSERWNEFRIAGGSYISTIWLDRCNRWAGDGAQVCLEIPSNGQAHAPGLWNAAEKRFEDVILIYRAGPSLHLPLPPGHYPITASIRHYRVVDDPEGGLEDALPSGTIDFGVVGVVHVIGTYVTNFRVEGVSEGERPGGYPYWFAPVGTEITWAARVTNPSSVRVTETIKLKAWKNGNWENPAVNRSKTVTLEPGEGRKVGFSKVMNTVGVWDYQYGKKIVPDLFGGEFWAE